MDDIDVSTVMLNGVIQTLEKPIEIGDYDNDGILDLMVKFGRALVQDILNIGANVEISITGMVGGLAFEGSDIIRITK